MSKFTTRLRVVTQEAALHRLCRVSTSWRGGEPVHVYEVREPTPENLARVGELVRSAHGNCARASGTVFVALA